MLGVEGDGVEKLGKLGKAAGYGEAEAEAGAGEGGGAKECGLELGGVLGVEDELGSGDGLEERGALEGLDEELGRLCRFEEEEAPERDWGGSGEGEAAFGGVVSDGGGPLAVGQVVEGVLA